VLAHLVEFNPSSGYELVGKLEALDEWRDSFNGEVARRLPGKATVLQADNMVTATPITDSMFPVHQTPNESARNAPMENSCPMTKITSPKPTQRFPEIQRIPDP
jgi:hypothetical protein